MFNNLPKTNKSQIRNIFSKKPVESTTTINRGNESMLKGKVKFFNKEKGFGFLITEDLKEYFFHHTDVRSFDLPDFGDMVDFEASTNAKGDVAKNVRVTSKNQDKKLS